MQLALLHQVEAPFSAAFGPFDYHLLVLNLTGPVQATGRVGLASQRKRIPPGRITFWPAGTGFSLELEDEFESLHLQLDATVIDDLLAEVEAPFSPRPIFGEHDQLLENLMVELWRTAKLEGAGARAYSDRLARLIASRLLWRSHSSEDEGAEKKGFTTAQLRRIDDFIEDHMDTTIALEDLGALMGSSTSHFARLFKVSIGKTPYQYVLEKRVGRAKHLLKHTRRAIVEISLDCGFSHQEHLTHAFRRFTGTTPARYRKSG